MKNSDFYKQILGLEAPWEVTAVELDVPSKRVHVRIGYREGTLWGCPETGERLPCHDHVERSWRHLDTCKFETLLTCRVPRLRLGDGSVWTLPVPWAEKGSRFTIQFEGFVVNVLEACQNISAASDLVDLSWDQLHRIMERAVARGLENRELEDVKHLGLDEKSFAKGQSYVSVMTDLFGGRVLEVVKGRDSEAGQLLLESLPEGVKQAVDAVCIDMSAAYEAAIRRGLPNADIVHDRFHISAHLNDAVAKVHREENARLQGIGDDRLKGSRSLFLYAPENLDRPAALRLQELRKIDLKTSRAWAIKEYLRWFWSYSYEGCARKHFQSWYQWAVRSRLRPIIKVAKMLKRHFENIITYLHHPITNAVTEGLNSKIQSIKNNARGFRSFANYRTRILFFCGKLNFNPL